MIFRPFLLRRSRGLAAIAQAFMPSVPVDFVALNLGLDSGLEARNACQLITTKAFIPSQLSSSCPDRVCAC